LSSSFSLICANGAALAFMVLAVLDALASAGFGAKTEKGASEVNLTGTLRELSGEADA